MKYKQHIITGASIIFLCDEGTKVVPREDPSFQEIKKLLADNKTQTALDLLDIPKRFAKTAHPRVFIDPKTGDFYIDNDRMAVVFGHVLKNLLDVGATVEPLVRFWDRLKKNPSLSAKQSLYDFLYNTGIPLTEDGCFVAYKKVRKDDLKDIYSGKFDNTPGQTVKVDRSSVVEDRAQTCASGLHVCAYSYLPHYGGDGAVLEVRVDPEHVVSVPVDYDNAKMRVCQYQCIRVVNKENQDVLYKDPIEAKQPVPAKKPEPKKPAKKASIKKLPFVLRVGARGRLLIPQTMLIAIGATDGVCCEARNAVLTIRKASVNDQKRQDVFLYALAGHTLKIGPQVLKQAGLRGKAFSCKISEKRIIISK